MTFPGYFTPIVVHFAMFLIKFTSYLTYRLLLSPEWTQRTASHHTNKVQGGTRVAPQGGCSPLPLQASLKLPCRLQSSPGGRCYVSSQKYKTRRTYNLATDYWLYG